MKTKPLGERQILDVVNELDALGMVEALSLSWGRHGYSKVITLRVNPETVLDIFQNGESSAVIMDMHAEVQASS